VVCLAIDPKHLPKRVLLCDLILRLSVSRILSFPQVHPAAAYIFVIVFPTLLSSFYLSINNMFQKAVPKEDVTSPVSHHSCTVRRIFLSSVTVSSTLRLALVGTLWWWTDFQKTFTYTGQEKNEQNTEKWSVVMWSKLTWFMWRHYVLKWSGVTVMFLGQNYRVY